MIQDLSNRTILKVSGNDAARYINGQVSQDVTLASNKLALYSIVASFKGKIQGDFYIRMYNGDLLIDTSPSQQESLLTRLDKYLIADDAEIEDISNTYNLYHTLGTQEDSLEDLSLANWECNRYGSPGRDYLLPSSEKLPSTDPEINGEKLRISNKIPSWPSELNENILPPEAGIEERAISYTKGCYTGQEVISRMKSAGKTNRHLVGFKFNHSISLPTDLYSDKECSGKPAATITSACDNESNSKIGLGYRTRKHHTIELFYDQAGNTYSTI